MIDLTSVGCFEVSSAEQEILSCFPEVAHDIAMQNCKQSS